MVLGCSLEHKAHIPSPDLGGGRCSTAGWDLWDARFGDAEGEAPWSPLCVGAGAESCGGGSSTEGARDELFISAD